MDVSGLYRMSPGGTQAAPTILCQSKCAGFSRSRDTYHMRKVKGLSCIISRCTDKQRGRTVFARHCNVAVDNVFLIHFAGKTPARARAPSFAKEDVIRRRRVLSLKSKLYDSICF